MELNNAEIGITDLKVELKKLENTKLNEKVKSLAVQERKLTQVILEHIAEVDRRRLFLDMAYPSLFDYLTKEIGYSSGAAQRRIDAARLIQKIPEVSEQINTGVINLAQISRLQGACRQIKKESGKAVDIVIQKDLLQKLENQSTEKTELILAQEFQIKLKTNEKKHIQRDESVRIELTFSKEEMALIKSAQALLSHKTGGTLKATFLEMANKIVKTSTATVAVKNPSMTRVPATLKTVTPRLKKEILNRDQVCQFKDEKSGKICASNYFLEIDHIRPKFAKGGNEPENLRVLCKNHNIFRYMVGL